MFAKLSQQLRVASRPVGWISSRTTTTKFSNGYFSTSSAAEIEDDMVLLSVDETGFATMTLNRPKVHNAFSDVVIKKIASRLDEVESNPNVRGLFLRSTGKNFCAGGDLDWMRRAASYSKEENIADAMVLSRMLLQLGSLPVPTIAVVQGAAFGGGVGLVSACDIAIAAENSSFMLSEVKLGILPATISPYVLRRIGAHQCRRYFLTGERFDAKRAQEIGLLHEVVADADALETKAQELKSAILTCSPTGIRESKKLIDAVAGKPITEDVLMDTSIRLADQRKSPEGVEGISAFFEKRPASWVPKKE